MEPNPLSKLASALETVMNSWKVMAQMETMTNLEETHPGMTLTKMALGMTKIGTVQLIMHGVTTMALIIISHEKTSRLMNGQEKMMPTGMCQDAAVTCKRFSTNKNGTSSKELQNVTIAGEQLWDN